MRCNPLFFFLTASVLFARIEEAHHFQEIRKHVDEQAWVILDIDDTLMTPVQMLGNDTWFDYRLKTHQEALGDFSQALEKTIAEWEAIRHLTKMRLIEPETSYILKELQEQKIPLMGVTVQGLALATRTVLQLLEHQIDLSLTALTHEDHCFRVEGHTVLYRQGILFTSGKSKGESFFQFCEKVGEWPRKIVMMDDKRYHLERFEKEAMKRGVEFVGLHYMKKGDFSPEIAQYQLEHSTLLHLVSDEEARESLD